MFFNTDFFHIWYYIINITVVICLKYDHPVVGLKA